MTNVQRRLERLEAAMIQHDTPAWPEVNAALDRHTARIRLVVCKRLGTELDHFAIVHAREILRDDTPKRYTSKSGARKARCVAPSSLCSMTTR